MDDAEVEIQMRLFFFLKKKKKDTEIISDKVFDSPRVLASLVYRSEKTADTNTSEESLEI